MNFKAQTFTCMILICSIPVLKAQFDKTELEREEATSWCYCFVKGIIYTAGYVIPKTIILKMTGIMSSGIAPGSIADKTYTAVTNAKGHIIPKDSIFD